MLVCAAMMPLDCAAAADEFHADDALMPPPAPATPPYSHAAFRYARRNTPADSRTTDVTPLRASRERAQAASAALLPRALFASAAPPAPYSMPVAAMLL